MQGGPQNLWLAVLRGRQAAVMVSLVCRRGTSGRSGHQQGLISFVFVLLDEGETVCLCQMRKAELEPEVEFVFFNWDVDYGVGAWFVICEKRGVGPT